MDVQAVVTSREKILQNVLSGHEMTELKEKMIGRDASSSSQSSSSLSPSSLSSPSRSPSPSLSLSPRRDEVTVEEEVKLEERRKEEVLAVEELESVTREYQEEEASVTALRMEVWNLMEDCLDF